MKELTIAAQTAKQIRQLLKEKFPSQKFTIKSKNFSMGNSVNVSWENGVNPQKVDELISKYQYGHFNGMEDIYEYSNQIKDLPQAKFVNAHRNITENIYQKAFDLAKDYFVFLKGKTSLDDRLENPDIGLNVRNFFYRKLYGKDLTGEITLDLLTD